MGVPEVPTAGYRGAFGLLDGERLEEALDDGRELFRLLESLGIRLVCVTAGSPYYNPHIQRPALFPPTDGYLPPEDPLRGVARQIAATARLKAAFPNLVIVGSAYSYLQEWLPERGAARRGGRARPTSWASGGWPSPTPSCPRTCSRGCPCSARRSAAPSATARAARATASCRAASPSTPSTLRHPDAERLRQAKAALPA